MLERLLHVGAAYPLLLTPSEVGGGTGGLCSLGVQTPAIGNATYKYIPFAPNGINSAASAGLDVTSYNFTGCIMATYKLNGIVYVCHVSTGGGQDCKAEWDRVKAGALNVFEFKPSDFVETGGAVFVGCVGLLTSDLQTWSITLVGDRKAPTIAAMVKARLLR